LKTRSQIKIDQYIAKPLAFIMNFIVRIAGKIFSIDHNLNKDFKVIAVCKFKGMGSIIQATPMLQAIRNKYPEASIIFISTASNKELLNKIDIIDQIITINDKNLLTLLFSCVSAIISLIRKRPGIYIDLEIYSDFSTLFTLFTLSKNRIGFYLRSSSFRMGIYTHMMFFNPQVPVANVYLQIASLLGCETENKYLYNLSHLSNFSKHEKEYIVINPNASDLRLERRWSGENFVKLTIGLLKENPHLNVIFIGSKAEIEYTQTITEQINDSRVINLAGKTSLDELISTIHHAKLMISNDTGPMHIAFCTGTPIVCLFGPCSPNQYGINNNSYVIYKRVYCSPCVHDFKVPPCGGNNICMKLIELEEVQKKVMEILSYNPAPKEFNFSKIQYKSGSTTIGLVNRN
jgi:ADP-heptose:LPS heptosyltransferase